MISIITHSYYLTPWGCRDLDTTVDSIEYIYLFKKWRPMRSELTIDTISKLAQTGSGRTEIAGADQAICRQILADMILVSHIITDIAVD